VFVAFFVLHFKAMMMNTDGPMKTRYLKEVVMLKSSTLLKRTNQIFLEIKKGAILENVVLDKETKTVDFEDVSITQNTRVSYPIYHIDNIQEGSGENKKYIFPYRSFGILPPISRLTPGQAAYHFISGYTQKVAGLKQE
jgi:ATP-dependent phosphoenolpyruvate carboxykinase